MNEKSKDQQNPKKRQKSNVYYVLMYVHTNIISFEF